MRMNDFRNGIESLLKKDEVDPALKMANQEKNEILKSMGLQAIAAHVLDTGDIDRAKEIAEKIPDSKRRDLTLNAILGEFVRDANNAEVALKKAEEFNYSPFGIVDLHSLV